MTRFRPVESPYLVPFAGGLHLDREPTQPPKKLHDKQANEVALAGEIAKLSALQRKLFADNRHAILLVFQAMDAAGKDSTIRAVLSGVNPAGCQVYAFTPPSDEELDHDFLWRVHRALPERGRIGVFNRSHYEEVITVRVEPSLLERQRLPHVPKKLDKLWEQRLESIREAEHHWARSGVTILKFFLHLSKDEQKARLLKRLEEPESHWKFAPGDLLVRAKWDEYMEAYQTALEATSRPYAPWYCIPADDKPYMRRTIAELVVQTLEGLPLDYGTRVKLTPEELSNFRAELEHE